MARPRLRRPRVKKPERVMGRKRKTKGYELNSIRWLRDVVSPAFDGGRRHRVCTSLEVPGARGGQERTDVRLGHRGHAHREQAQAVVENAGRDTEASQDPVEAPSRLKAAPERNMARNLTHEQPARRGDSGKDCDVRGD